MVLVRAGMESEHYSRFLRVTYYTSCFVEDFLGVHTEVCRGVFRLVLYPLLLPLLKITAFKY